MSLCSWPFFQEGAGASIRHSSQEACWIVYFLWCHICSMEICRKRIHPFFSSDVLKGPYFEMYPWNNIVLLFSLLASLLSSFMYLCVLFLITFNYYGEDYYYGQDYENGHVGELLNLGSWFPFPCCQASSLLPAFGCFPPPPPTCSLW